MRDPEVVLRAAKRKGFGRRREGQLEFEPATYGLEGRCSIQLSYDPL